jgi:hypothetical protein
MSIWTNWDPLEEVIVGNCPSSISSEWAVPENVRRNFNQILSETKEDLDNLSKLLVELGVKVHRPNICNFDQHIKLDQFNIKNATFPIVPRDQYFVYGTTIYQTYTSMPDRYLDSLNYYEIFTDLYNRGYNWISQPPPLLKDLDSYGRWELDGLKIYGEAYKNKLLWHTATLFKCGDALITNTKGPGSMLGLEWVKRNINSRIISNFNTAMNGWGHIDHGFYMTDDETVICRSKDWVPVFLRNKKIIELQGLYTEFDYKEYLEKNYNKTDKFSVEWIDEWLTEWKGYSQDLAWETNVLVVDSQNLIFANNQPKVFEKLAELNIKCHVSPIRHGMFWEAGIHCLTLDVARRGNNRVIC